MGIRAGDSVLHKPTGETWCVAAISPDGKQLACCGWPETLADVSDCELKEPASDQEHWDVLHEVIQGCKGQTRASWAKQNKDATP